MIRKDVVALITNHGELAVNNLHQLAAASVSSTSINYNGIKVNLTATAYYYRYFNSGTHPTEFQFEETADFEGMPMTIFLYTAEDKVNSISYKGIIENDSDKAADLAGKMISKANEMYGTPVTYDEPYKERTFKDKDIKAFIEAKEMKDLFDIWQIYVNI